MIARKLRFTENASEDLEQLHMDPSKKKVLKAVLKTLGLMETNLRHPSLNTHEYHSFKGPNREKVFEAYAQQNTPCAYRIFWYYGPEKDMISILSIIAHP
jgi:hypothetical protein